jgi:hypothetical protein
VCVRAATSPRPRRPTTTGGAASIFILGILTKEPAHGPPGPRPGSRGKTPRMKNNFTKHNPWPPSILSDLRSPPSPLKHLDNESQHKASAARNRSRSRPIRTHDMAERAARIWNRPQDRAGHRETGTAPPGPARHCRHASEDQ